MIKDSVKSMRSLFQPEMLLYIVILFLIDFARGAALVSFLPIYGEKELGLDLDVIGAGITAHYLTDTAMKLVLGYLLDRLSVRRIVSLGLFCSLAGVTVMQFADAPWVFILACAVFGIGISPIWIVCLTKVNEEGRATQMGFLYTIWLVGLGAGPVVTNFFLDIDRTLTYWIMVGVTAGAWLLSLLIKAGRTMHLDVVPFRKQLSILGSRLKEMKPLLPGMVLQTLGAGMLLPILPKFASDNLGMSTSHYSLLLVIGGGCTVLGLIPMGRLSDVLGKKWFLVIGFLAFGTVMLALTGHPPIALALFWAFVLGVSYAAVLPAWNALLAAYVPPGQKGLGWGVFSTVEGIGGMIGPYVGGIVATHYGAPTVVAIAGMMFMCISLFYVFFPFRVFRGESG